MASLSRAGEDGDIPSRHERIINNGDTWSFVTREGFTIGPYQDPEEAKRESAYFIQYTSHESPAVVRLLNLYDSNAIVDFLRTSAQVAVNDHK